MVRQLGSWTIHSTWCYNSWNSRRWREFLWSRENKILDKVFPSVLGFTSRTRAHFRSDLCQIAFEVMTLNLLSHRIHVRLQWSTLSHKHTHNFSAIYLTDQCSPLLQSENCLKFVLLVVSNSKFWRWQELLLSRDQKILDKDFPFVLGGSCRTHARFRRNTWRVYSLLALQELTTVRAGVLLSFYGQFLTVWSLGARIRPSTDLAFPLQAFTGECVILCLPCALEFSGDQLNFIPEGGFCSAASSNCCGRCYLLNKFQGICI
jgi:hypothetical protein